MKKKLMLVFAIILIVINLIFSPSVFAEPTTTATSTGGTATATPTTTTTTTTTDPAKQNLELLLPRDGDGNLIDMTPITSTVQEEILTSTPTVTLKNTDPNATTETTTKKYDTKKYVKNSYGTAGSALTTVWSFVVGSWINNIPEAIVESTGSKVKNNTFTIYDLVTGEYDFFNLDFYDVERYENLDKDSIASNIISNLFTFYKTLRNIALALSLFVLMYIAIRMATSTTAIQRSKFQNMLIAWFTSVCILFFMHYIIIVISYVNHFALDIAKNFAESLGVENIEVGIMKGQIKSLGKGQIGFHLFQTLILVSIFIFYQIKYLIAYTKRFCEIAFLIIISPLVTVTYAIDKVGDNRAQAFSMWFKELSSKYLLQFVHAMTYIIFLAAAGEIAKTMPLLAAFFLWAMGKSEVVIRNVLGLQGEKQMEKARPPRIPGLPGFLRGRHKH